MSRHRSTVGRSGGLRARRGLGVCVVLALVVVATSGTSASRQPESLLFALASDPTGPARVLDAAEVPAARVLVFGDVRAVAHSWRVDGQEVSEFDAQVAAPTTMHHGPGLELDAAALGRGTHTVSAVYRNSDGSERVVSSWFWVGTPWVPDPAPRAEPTASPSPSPTGEPAVEPAPPPAEPAPGQAPPAGTPGAPASGWPNAATTGPRDGHALAPSGPLVITTAGAVVADLDVAGCIDVQAPNVTITDVRVSCDRTTTAIRIHDGASATISYVEINGNGVVSTAVGFASYTLSHVDIHQVIDGPRVNSNVQVLDSYIHDLTRTADSHNDAIQTTGGTGIVIRGNNLQAYEPASGDPMNAAIMIGSENQPLRDVVIEGNLLNGGNYTILARSDLDGGNVVVRGNHFGRNFRYGPYRGAGGMAFDASNVWADTLAPIG